MPCIFMVDIRHIVIYLTTIKYAFYIPGWYMTNLFISPTIKYALHIPGRCGTDLHISPLN